MDKVTLNTVQQHKWVKNFLVFLAPVGVIYLTTIIGAISVEGHAFSFKDLVPTTFAQGGIVLWFLNTALDYLRKLRG